VSIEVRQPTSAELALVRGTWQPQMRPRYRDASNMGPQMRGHQWGPDRYLGQATAAEMMRRHVDAHTTIGEVLVAAVASEPMAWVSRTLYAEGEEPVCVVHFCYTIKPARREGLGSTLLRYVRREAETAGARCVPGCMTAAGLALWESEKST
jgi:GNAT superfamily N-acetyltransferase